MVKRFFICFIFLSVICSIGLAQGSKEEETKAFILKVVSSYKNPLAYFPLRRDLFLPSQQELDSINHVLDSYSSPHVMYGILFDTNDSIKREPFVDAHGDLLFPAPLSKYHSSKANSFQYFKRRQNHILNSNPNLGKFLYYNRQFKDSGNSQKH